MSFEFLAEPLERVPPKRAVLVTIDVLVKEARLTQLCDMHHFMCKDAAEVAIEAI